ncbi:TPA: aspartate-semialdehyde dehydrogenase [Candidatus Peribacteria bacterium]|nr:MAG: aspartate-semialdehyde dehydrogenase [Candidatus Peribacteria bacterium RIFOXYC2_FULL_58_10]HAI98952.1 aspartate-semialdehyde dehydrogenase [Candidatus Peribacteria bacterium]HAS34757.1 aspartate-semialdehyde dehydrogenase [Candidatus Peribacteria bacterium]
MKNIPSPSGERLPVEILGATGMVGQHLITRLTEHPWFRIEALKASERSAGKRYGDTVDWALPQPIPRDIAQMEVLACEPSLPGRIALSGLDADIAGPIEEQFAEFGYPVVSNARNHRFDPDVPLLIPEVNRDHLAIIAHQRFAVGCIITNPNCSTVGITMALKPLQDAFGVEAADIVTLQAASGAGNRPGVSSLRLIDNTIPFIAGEEEKIQTEPKKILGTYRDGVIRPAEMAISAQCNRVPVRDGHTACVKVALRTRASLESVMAAFESYGSPLKELELPSAPDHPLIVHHHPAHPQPYFHRDLEDGMAASVGRIQPCGVLDYKFVVLSHNTVRGAAGAAILNAELLVRTALSQAIR